MTQKDNKYTQRDWDRTVGWGKVPKEYKKQTILEDYKNRIDYDMWTDVMHVDPDKRPWTYDCSGNKVLKTEDGEPDYTTIWNKDDLRKEKP